MKFIKSVLPMVLLFFGQFTNAQEYNEFGQATEIQADKPDMSASAMLKRGEKAWVGNLCKQLSDSGQIFVVELDIAKGDKGCPRLRDYSKVEQAYREQAERTSDVLYGTRRETGVPPHQPGTICITNQGWYGWARVPGYVGQRCSLPSTYGDVEGVLD